MGCLLGHGILDCRGLTPRVNAATRRISCRCHPHTIAQKKTILRRKMRQYFPIVSSRWWMFVDA